MEMRASAPPGSEQQSDLVLRGDLGRGLELGQRPIPHDDTVLGGDLFEVDVVYGGALAVGDVD